MVQTRAIQARRIAVVFSSVVGAGTAALLGAGQSSQTANTAPRPRLFTEAQAASGETVYRQSCAACHGATLTGGTAPSLTGPRFETSWGDPRVTLADLFFIMPSRSVGCDTRVPAVGPRTPSCRGRARDCASGSAGLHSRRRGRGAGHQRSRPGHADRVGTLDRLAVPRPRLQRDPILAASGDQHHDGCASRAGVRVSGRRARQLPNRADRLQRHDVCDDHDEHHRARLGDVPRQVAACLDVP
ncbi:MAG: hypothetical protein DMF96_05815 [Acidobacteria bacterium]|nr:MAG: hypothetical protein DMF96_05815 [Acidobacteriota bacterium]